MLTQILESPPHFSLRAYVVAGLFFLTAAGGSQPVWAYKPEDPEVRAMVDRGVKYLESLSEDQLGKNPWAATSGQVILCALAHLKAEHNEDAPLVQMGLQQALKIAGSIKGTKLEHTPKATYETAVAIMFLAELDPEKYAKELQQLGDGLFALQMRHGGYGYPGEPNGDVSQSQYVMLAMWTLDRAKIPIPLDRAKSLLVWMTRVQDVSGSWPYRGVFPPSRNLIVQPKEVMSISTSLAGGCSVLIGSDIFRIWGNATAQGNGVEGLPKAIKRVETDELIKARRAMSPVKDVEIIDAANRMNGFRRANPYRRKFGHDDWYYYQIYTLERFESFMELALGRPTDPAWYDDVVVELQGHQDASGGWGIKDKAETQSSVCTAFAILFLIRSTKKAIGLPSQGTMMGGWQIPADTTKIVVNNGQIKAEKPPGSVTDLLDLLEADDEGKDKGSIPENLKLETDPTKRRIQIDRLERVLHGSKSWDARRVAARLLGTSDQLSVVPTLIYAVSDPDKPTRRYAINGLQFISRKFDLYDLPDNADSAQVRDCQKKWIAWYQTMYPDFIYTEDGF